MLAWPLAWLLPGADPVTTATDSLIAQGTGWAAAVVVSAVVVGLWRRDVRRSDEALTRETKRADKAEEREQSAREALDNLNREVRTETTRIMQTTADRLEETALALRDTRRQP